MANKALLFLASAVIAGIFLHGPITQDPAYHLFADTRSFIGIPNFGNVVSNLPFLLVGLLGLRTRNAGTLSAGVLLVSAGSAYYHWNPSSEALLWDRLPMTVAFMALFSMLLEERVTNRKTLLPLLILGVSSALYWRWTGDLRLYVIVQFLPIILIPLILTLYPPKYLSTRLLAAALILYISAKVFESYDRQILMSLNVSGHTIKHLLAGAATLCIILAVPRSPHVSRP